MRRQRQGERHRETERQRQETGGFSGPNAAPVSRLEGPLEREGVQVQIHQFLW